jgi:dihydroxy-acid dehydratase
VFDVPNRELRVELPNDEIAQRVADYEPPPPKYTSGVLGKYAKHVGSAAEGAVTS